MSEPIVLTGVLGWGNPGCNTLSSLDCYGPGGRWGDGNDPGLAPPMNGRNGEGGDLLPDALAREGLTEGASLVVVAVSRQAQMADRGLAERIESAIRAAVGGERP